MWVGDWNQILVYIEAIVRVYNRFGRRDNLYKARRDEGIMQATYYSDECAPGGALDEHLSDSTWAP